MTDKVVDLEKRMLERHAAKEAEGTAKLADAPPAADPAAPPERPSVTLDLDPADYRVLVLVTLGRDGAMRTTHLLDKQDMSEVKAALHHAIDSLALQQTSNLLRVVLGSLLAPPPPVGPRGLIQ